MSNNSRDQEIAQLRQSLVLARFAGETEKAAVFERLLSHFQAGPADQEQANGNGSQSQQNERLSLAYAQRIALSYLSRNLPLPPGLLEYLKKARAKSTKVFVLAGLFSVELHKMLGSSLRPPALFPQDDAGPNASEGIPRASGAMQLGGVPNFPLALSRFHFFLCNEVLKTSLRCGIQVAVPKQLPRSTLGW